jgi:pSer/pThr/pTyr-binding forkhead associated (FHA) protein
MDVKLVFFKPDGSRKDFPLPKPTTVVGRGEDCELQVPLASVSRRHCEVTAEGNTVKVRDLASANGTYVNNERVTEQDLLAGDRLVVGPVVFTVQIDGKPEEIKPVKTRGQLMAEAGEGGAEAVVDLQADVVATGGEADDMAALAASAEEEAEVDPIAALEAMAAESDKKKKKKES